LAQAAESCFGTDQWPGKLPELQAWIEFEVGSIEQPTAELKSQGYKRLVLKKVADATHTRVMQLLGEKREQHRQEQPAA